MFLDKQIIWFSKKAEKQYHKQILLNLNLFAFSDRIYSIHFILQTVVYALQNKNKQPPKCFTILQPIKAGFTPNKGQFSGDNTALNKAMNPPTNIL